MTQEERIRQEIERRIEEIEYVRMLKSKYMHKDFLPEEDTTEDLNELIQKWDRIDINTVLKVKVKATGKVIDGFYDGRGHFDHFIDHDVFDRYSIDEVELMPHEESDNELEKEIERYFYYEYTDNTPYEVIARHFAEWGAKHLKM